MKAGWWIAAVLLVGCKTNNAGGGGNSAGTPAKSATAALSGPTSAGPPNASVATAPTPSPTGPTSELKLASGAKLTLPAGAIGKEIRNPSQRLPGTVKQAHKFQIGNAERVLYVNEMSTDKLACNALLDRELDRINKAKEDPNVTKRAMREVQGVSELKVAGHRVLYALSKNRVPAPGTDTVSDQPQVGMATLMMCRDKDYIVLMYASKKGEPSADIKKMLVDLAASYKPGA